MQTYTDTYMYVCIYVYIYIYTFTPKTCWCSGHRNLSRLDPVLLQHTVQNGTCIFVLTPYDLVLTNTGAMYARVA